MIWGFVINSFMIFGIEYCLPFTSGSDSLKCLEFGEPTTFAFRQGFVGVFVELTFADALKVIWREHWPNAFLNPKYFGLYKSSPCSDLQTEGTMFQTKFLTLLPFLNSFAQKRSQCGIWKMSDTINILEEPIFASCRTTLATQLCCWDKKSDHIVRSLMSYKCCRHSNINRLASFTTVVVALTLTLAHSSFDICDSYSCFSFLAVLFVLAKAKEGNFQ